jgi:diguanylate cyclase (GGDEF)-like protein/PAS domain S-box-containing protein
VLKARLAVAAGAGSGSRPPDQDGWGEEILAARWRMACGAVALGAFQLSRSGRVTSSPELDLLCGLCDETLLTVADLVERVHVEDRAALLNTLTARVGVGSSVDVPFRLLRRDGEVHRVRLRGTWVGPPATPLLAAVVLDDAVFDTERLSDLARRYQTLAEVSPDIIVVHQAGKVVYVNPAAVRHIRAQDASQLIGQPILDFFAPESRNAFIQRLATMNATHGVAAFFEERLIALDGTPIDIEATSIPTSWEGRPAFQAVARVITDRKTADRTMREQAALIDIISDAIVVCAGLDRRELRVLSWSKGAETLYGWGQDEVQGCRLAEVLGDDWDDGAWWQGVLAEGSGATERVHVARDGRRIPVNVSATVYSDDAGKRAGVILVSSDISARKAAETARAALEERYSAVVAALEEGILVVGETGRIEAANAAVERILGADPGTLVGSECSQTFSRIVDERGARLAPEDCPPLVTLRSGRAQTNVVLGLVSGLEPPRGPAATWVSINAVALSSTLERGRSVVCSLSDITDGKLARDRLAFMANHDMLTNLANRSGISAQLEAFGYDGPLAVLFIDLDRFKVINDSMGHGAGDQVLSHVAGRLVAASRPGDVVGRLAGDEFVILCAGMSTRHTALSMAERILRQLEQPMTVTDAHGSSRSVSISASVGIAFVKRSEAATKVLVDADMAMYLAKERGRSRVEVFDNQLRAAASERISIQADLQATIEQASLHLVHQPIVGRDGSVRGYEALVRWDHPQRGVVPPSEFIPIAEETGLISALGSFVLTEATATAARWQAAGHCQYVSVNLSARQLSDPELVTTVEGVLAESGLRREALCLEITESSVMANPEHAAVTLAGLKDLGVMLAIDDFGTGYSSLAYLHRFPVDVLKIDQSFVAGLVGADDTTGARSIVVAIVSLAHALGLSVIAEGVETAEQARILDELAVDGRQGYFYGRPTAAPFPETDEAAPPRRLAAAPPNLPASANPRPRGA